MKIIIVGAGEIGRHLAEKLVLENHEIQVIDSSAQLVEELNEALDLRAIHADGASVLSLEEASIAECELLLALTPDDNTNLVAASMGKALGAKKAVARIHSGIAREEWLFNYRTHFGIDYLFSSDRLAAIELAKFIRNPEGILIEEIARGRIELQQLPVTAQSKVTGRPIAEIGLPQRVRIGLVQRGSSAFVPGREDTIAEGDMVMMFGETRRLREATSLIDPRYKPPVGQRIAIFGGTECGVALAQMLESTGHSVRIFEKDRKRCEAIAQHLQQTTVLNLDATSLLQLREEQIASTDFFVATSNADEDNVMTCLQAGDLGAGTCLALIHRADYADAMQHLARPLGIRGAVSPREASRRELMRFMNTGTYRSVIDLGGGVSVMECPLSETAPVAHQPVEKIAWPAGTGLIALLRESMAIVPAAGDVLMPGDIVYSISTEAEHKAMAKLFGVR